MFHVVVGLASLLLGFWGLVDPRYHLMEMFRGVSPAFFLLAGMLSVILGMAGQEAHLEKSLLSDLSSNIAEEKNDD